MTTLVSSLLSAGCSVVGYRGQTETPNYTVIDCVDDVEIRHYEPRLAAETVVNESSVEKAREVGFKRLAGYIFGDNEPNRKIDMTAPVAQTSTTIDMTAPVAQNATSDGWLIQFFLPRDWSIETAPQPTDERIELAPIAAENYAVLRFSNSRSESAVESHTERLRHELVASVWRPTGQAIAWFYDPPWTLPFLRRNEVALPVERVTTSAD